MAPFVREIVKGLIILTAHGTGTQAFQILPLLLAKITTWRCSKNLVFIIDHQEFLYNSISREKKRKKKSMGKHRYGNISQNTLEKKIPNLRTNSCDSPSHTWKHSWPSMDQCLLYLNVYLRTLENTNSDSVDTGWGLAFFTSNNIPRDTNTASQETKIGTARVYTVWWHIIP